MSERESLSLKWGTLKSWSLKQDSTLAALRRYRDGGVHGNGAIFQVDTPAQKRAIYDLIDALDGDILNEFSGEIMSKDAAKQYVRCYRTPA